LGESRLNILFAFRYYHEGVNDDAKRCDQRGRVKMEEAMISLLWFLLIGGLAGWLAGKLTRGRGFGVIGDIAVGIAGSLIGRLLFGLLGLGAYGFIGSLVMATIGAVVLVIALRAVRRS
jgi:uncharacterized membrane protein YeaQ/YmgE (transglycosylase-associated protein family)